MELILGRLSFRDDGTLSILTINEGQEFLLLMINFADDLQSAIAATHFIKDVKHLEAGKVAVSGTKGLQVSQPVVRMSDINAIGAWADALTNNSLHFESRMAKHKSGGAKKQHKRVGKK